MILLSAVAGYLIGSVPTANALGKLWGVDLRSEGTRNPGTRNALGTGGFALAAVVLLIELAKGILAVIIGAQAGGEGGAVAGGLGAVAGNVYNIWYRFSGGKGLATSAGALIGLWPVALIPTVAALVGVVAVTGSSGAGAVTAVAVLLLSSLAWWAFDITTGWGVQSGPILLAVAIGLGAILWPKHAAEASFTRWSHRGRPAQESRGPH